MSIRVLYFAALREALGRSGEDVPASGGVATVADLRARLLARGGAFEALAERRNLRVAVNQRMAQPHTPVADGDEVAFFPPVTGG
jgi:molybdopterin synthase sulfur carrier subunit